MSDLPPMGYHGRLWDSPMTDGMPKVDLTGEECFYCGEPIAADDDALRLATTSHTECVLRSVLGDVAHLEGRCLCAGGRDHDEEGTFREQAQRALQWMVDNGRGRWAEGSDKSE